MHGYFQSPLLFSDLKRNLLNVLSLLSMKRMIVIVIITVASSKFVTVTHIKPT